MNPNPAFDEMLLAQQLDKAAEQAAAVHRSIDLHMKDRAIMVNALKAALAELKVSTAPTNVMGLHVTRLIEKVLETIEENDDV